MQEYGVKMKTLQLEGRFPSLKHGEQLLREASWIIQNLGKSRTLEDKNKWTQKWFNWSKAHPREAEQIKKQIKAWSEDEN
jgi:hypothetical protein